MRSERFLFRGANLQMHASTGGRPRRKTGAPFSYTFHWDEPGSRWDSGQTWDDSTANAVIRHQLNQEGYPTAGVSTTPHFERAVLYAMGPCGTQDGVVYKIDRIKCREHGIVAYKVAEYARWPSVPGDDEVILVPPSECLPLHVIIDVISVSASQSRG